MFNITAFWASWQVEINAIHAFDFEVKQNNPPKVNNEAVPLSLSLMLECIVENDRYS